MEKTINDYEIIEEVGRGESGTVYKAKRSSDGKLIALKVIDIPPEQEKSIERSKEEIEYLKILSTPQCNPFVICYYDSSYDSSKRQFLIEMEYIEGKDMKTFIDELKQNNSDEVVYYYLLLIAKDLAKGLEYIHSKGIVHNDIKLENVIIDETFTPRIIDFGLSCMPKLLLQKYCLSHGGTPNYIPPEYFSENKKFPASDMWALGVLLYKAATGQFPYGHGTVPKIFKRIINREPPKLTTGNHQLNAVVNGLLVKDRTKRLKGSQVLSELQTIDRPLSVPVVPKIDTRESVKTEGRISRSTLALLL